MLDWFRAADHLLLAKINGAWSHPWLDAVLPVLTDLHKVKPLVFGAAPVALAWWLWSTRGQAWRVLAAIALAVALGDMVSHRVVKRVFTRSRPTKAGIAVVLRTPQHHGYSFPSNHATNMFAAAAAGSAAQPALAVPLFALAALVAYSRVYVGVHFPSDVAAGALLGAFLGWLVALALRRAGVLRGGKR